MTESSSTIDTSKDMKTYVAGFLFTEDLKQVLLVRKNRPDWQKGKLNGIGGKIEANETPLEAMIREFNEEAGLHITDWKEYAMIRTKEWEVFFFWTTSTKALTYQSKTDEPIEAHTVADLDTLPIIPNLRWLIPMALDPEQVHAVIDIA